MTILFRNLDKWCGSFHGVCKPLLEVWGFGLWDTGLCSLVVPMPLATTATSTTTTTAA